MKSETHHARTLTLSSALFSNAVKSAIATIELPAELQSTNDTCPCTDRPTHRTTASVARAMKSSNGIEIGASPSEYYAFLIL